MQGLGETVSNSKMTLCVLNALPPDWSSFATSIYSKKDTTPFYELWAQCTLEESRIKAKDDTESNEIFKAFIARTKKLRKRKFGKSKKKTNMSKIQCFGCNEYGNKRKEKSESHIVDEMREPKKKPKGEDPKDLYY